MYTVRLYGYDDQASGHFHPYWDARERREIPGYCADRDCPVSRVLLQERHFTAEAEARQYEKALIAARAGLVTFSVAGEHACQPPASRVRRLMARLGR